MIRSDSEALSKATIVPPLSSVEAAKQAFAASRKVKRFMFV
jgi:hypothetical protein